MLSSEVSLVGEYINGNLWSLRLVSASPSGPKAHGECSEGDLPSRETLKLGGFTAVNYVDFNLGRHYRVDEDASGTVVFRDSLT